MNIKEAMRKGIQGCDSLQNKEDIIACKFNLLYEVTELQDVINLNLMKTLNDDEDERWYPIHMIDNANGIILGLSRNRGRLKPILLELYVKEKVDSLNEKWSHIMRKK
jgi:hypothetical protein